MLGRLVIAGIDCCSLTALQREGQGCQALSCVTCILTSSNCREFGILRILQAMFMQQVLAYCGSELSAWPFLWQTFHNMHLCTFLVQKQTGERMNGL